MTSDREGLLSSDRNQNNNYCDCTDEDVERIKKIKILRMLGVSTADIRRLYEEELLLDEVLKSCMKRMEEEEKNCRRCVRFAKILLAVIWIFIPGMEKFLKQGNGYGRRGLMRYSHRIQSANQSRVRNFNVADLDRTCKG